MPTIDPQLAELADDLQRLLDRSPSSEDAMENWYLEADRVRSKLLRGIGVTRRIPAFLLHYLIEADVRLTDPRIREAQHRAISQTIANLRKGIFPTVEEGPQPSKD